MQSHGAQLQPSHLCTHLRCGELCTLLRLEHALALGVGHPSHANAVKPRGGCLDSQPRRSVPRTHQNDDLPRGSPQEEVFCAVVADTVARRAVAHDCSEGLQGESEGARMERSGPSLGLLCFLRVSTAGPGREGC